MASLNFLIRSSQTLHNPPKSPGQVLHSSRPTALAPTSVLVTFCCSNKVPWPRLHGQRIYFGLRFQRKSTTGEGMRGQGAGRQEQDPLNSLNIILIPSMIFIVMLRKLRHKEGKQFFYIYIFKREKPWGRFSFIANILSKDHGITNKNKSNVVTLIDIESAFN